MKEIILWQGEVAEIDSPESGRPLVWFSCDYDSGCLVYDGKWDGGDNNSHLLVLEHAVPFPGQPGQRFTLSICLFGDSEEWQWDSLYLIVGPIVEIRDEFSDDLVRIEAITSSGLICPQNNGEVGLLFEKGKVIGEVGQIVALRLEVSE